jgi:hypothetical protein
MAGKWAGLLAAGFAAAVLAAAGGSAGGDKSLPMTRLAQAPGGPSAQGGSPEKCQATCSTRSVACHQACSKVPAADAKKCVERCTSQFDACWSRCDGLGG